MSQKIGAKKKKLLGKMPEGFDYLADKMIEPDFYVILKEKGLRTARKPDGSYWDKESQRLWEEWQAP